MAAFWSHLPETVPAKSARLRSLMSAHVTPSLLPILVLAFSAYMAPQYPAIALTFVVSSFVLYSLRLGMTQGKQERAKLELAEAEERFRSLFHKNALPMWVVERSTGAFLEVNEAAIQRYGFTREQFLSRRVNDIVDNTGIENLVDKTLSRSQATPHEEIHRTASGEMFDAAVSMVTIEFGGKQAELCTIQDISERKKLEQQLRQSQKMEAVGTLAGGIAHDFNNLLTIITGYSQVIMERAGNDEQLRRELQQIEVAANKATVLIRQLLAFGRRQLLQPQVISLESVVLGVEKMLRRLIGENIDLVVRTTGTVSAVKADPGQIEQILVNLAVNARDAMESRNGGRLTFELQNIALDAQFARENIGAVPGEYVMLAVSDTGCGMDADTRSRIFEPFFTTKGSGGSGLGLATVYGIVQQSGGYITVSSTEGRGTTFRIFLPRVEGSPVSAESQPETRVEHTGSETIVLVEDDDGLRALTRRILLKHGYQVLEASRTSDAEVICREHPGKIQMLLTDVIMPGMSGKELSSRLGAIRPEMVVVYMSGYTDSVVMKQGVEEGAINFIQKPFSPATLSKTVREVLDAHFGKPNTVSRPYLRG
jgi:PAS domain S-box-containing protein